MTVLVRLILLFTWTNVNISCMFLHFMEITIVRIGTSYLQMQLETFTVSTANSVKSHLTAFMHIIYECVLHIQV